MNFEITAIARGSTPLEWSATHSTTASLNNFPKCLSSVLDAAVMPVHRDREKKETAAEEMEVEEQEQDASSSDEEDLETSSVSEDGDSSGEELSYSSEFGVNHFKLLLAIYILYNVVLKNQKKKQNIYIHRNTAAGASTTMCNSFMHRYEDVYYVTEMDEADCERRRMECLDEMSNLEKQFMDLKDQ